MTRACADFYLGSTRLTRLATTTHCASNLRLMRADRDGSGKEHFGSHDLRMQQARRGRVFFVVLQRAIAGGPHDPLHAARFRLCLSQVLINIGFAVGHADQLRARHFAGKLLATPQHVDPTLAFLLFDRQRLASSMTLRGRQGRLIRSGPNVRGDCAQGNAIRREGVQRMQETRRVACCRP